jgi:hypothetical protein
MGSRHWGTTSSTRPSYKGTRLCRQPHIPRYQLCCHGSYQIFLFNVILIIQLQIFIVIWQFVNVWQYDYETGRFWPSDYEKSPKTGNALHTVPALMNHSLTTYLKFQHSFDICSKNHFPFCIFYNCFFHRRRKKRRRMKNALPTKKLKKNVLTR